ncbi:MAG: histidine phosphatase family protein [Methylococcaceae bacterium]
MITTVDFLRHGEVAGGSYYRGSTDDLLTELGWQQMNHAVANKHWDYIVSSPLLRCLDFAQYFSKQTSIPLSTDSNWQEINFGDWEGKTAEQINSTSLMRFYQDPANNTPKNGENIELFLDRINLAWKSTTQSHKGKHILVITHAGVIRCLFNVFLCLPITKIFNIQVNHASLTSFQCIHDKPSDFIKLAFHNLS